MYTPKDSLRGGIKDFIDDGRDVACNVSYVWMMPLIQR